MYCLSDLAGDVPDVSSHRGKVESRWKLHVPIQI